MIEINMCRGIMRIIKSKYKWFILTVIAVFVLKEVLLGKSITIEIVHVTSAPVYQERRQFNVDTEEMVINGKTLPPKISKHNEYLTTPLTIKNVEIPTMSKKDENSEIPNMPETAVNIKSPNMPETAVNIENPNMPETAVNIGSPNMPETAENIESPNMPGTAVNIKSPNMPETAENTESPNMPETAVNIESPNMPETAVNIGSPKMPETAENIESPNMPETAVNIESPNMPGTAENIESPNKPETNENIESPTMPGTAENIKSPVMPDKTVKSENPSMPVKAENIESSNMPDTAENIEIPNMPYKAENIEIPNTPEQTENIASPAVPDQAVKSENPSMPVKAEHIESHISPEKAVHNELPQKKDKISENTTTYKTTKSEEKSKSPGARIWKEKFTGFMTEEEALIYKQCEDVNELTSPNTTKLIIKENNRNYKLNDRIQLTITAHDHYGKPKTEGGDMFLATIKSEFEKASAPGVVTDLHNGSYNVEFDALWTGKAVISVTLAYTKQIIAATMRLRIKHVPAAYMIAGYNKGNISDIGYCHVNRSMLIYNDICKGDNPVGPHVCKHVGLTPERVEICDFSSVNSGIPWYCLKPLNKGLGCEDWKYISRHNDTQLPGMTKCEQLAYFKIFLEISTKIDVNVEPQFDGDDRKMVDLPSNPCSKYNTTALWLRREPTGFYYNKIWHLRHCKGVRVDNICSCMKNKNFYIIGDSTMRQWYFNVMFRYSCNQTTEKWTEPKWYKKSVCRNEEHNFTLTFSAHNLPVSVPHTLERSIFSTSVSRYIDRIADDENAVLVFHLFGHMIPYHPEFYKLQLTTIRNSAEKLFRRNKLARIMIKAPHIFPEEKVIMAYQYDRISYEVFYDLFDRVYYLNNMDSSTAEMPTNIHPDPVIVDAMLDQALVYSCD